MAGLTRKSFLAASALAAMGLVACGTAEPMEQTSASSADAASAQASQPEPVAPGQSLYGFLNQEFFATFDSGVDGARVDPVFGELVCPDADLVFNRSWVSVASEKVEQQKAELAKALVAGKLTQTPDGAAKRLSNMYDLLAHAADDRVADEATFVAWALKISHASTPDELFAAVSDVFLQTGVNVLVDVSCARNKENGEVLPKVSPALPSAGVAIAYDPDLAKEFANAYKMALTEFATGLGIKVTDEDVSEAYSMQTHASASEQLYRELVDLREKRASMGGDYTSSKCEEDKQRLKELHAKDAAAKPEDVSEDAFEAMKKLGVANDQVVSLSEFVAATNIPVIKMLEDAGMATDRLIVESQDYSVFKDAKITKENLAAYKVNAVLLLAERLDFVPSAQQGSWDAMRRAVVCAKWGAIDAPQDYDANKDAEGLAQDVFALMPQDAGLLWADAYYDDSLSERVEELVGLVRDAWRVRLQGNVWLGNDELNVMLAKLDKLVAVVGKPSKDNCVFAEVKARADGGTAINGTVAVRKAEMERCKRMVKEEGYANKAFDQRVVGMDAPIAADALAPAVNNASVALIVPAASIVALVGDDAEGRMLPMVGMAIAREIGKLFDALGSYCDDNGAVRDWWSEAVRSEYAQKEERFKSHYGSFEAIAGATQDFGADVVEPMADFAGARIILDILVDDLEARQAFLETYAKSSWGVVSKAGLNEFFEKDSHPYWSVRTNALFSNFDFVYDLYEMAEEDAMFTPYEERLRLW